MIGVELFAGAGGMSLGASRAGVKVVASVELNKHASETYRLNHPDTAIYCDDISRVDFRPHKRRDDELVVFGGPPCQGFSTSNQRTRHSANPRNWLFLQFLRAVEEMDPEWVVFENVAGILQTDGGSFVRSFDDQLQSLGYRTSQHLLNARDFGVPQSRTRLFIIGNKAGKTFAHAGSLFIKPPTVMEAIGDLPLLENGDMPDVLPYATEPSSQYASEMRGGALQCNGHLVSRNADYVIERYRHIPEGGNWKDIPAALMQNYADRSRCHTGIYRRLDGNRESVVLGNFRKNMLIHPKQHRGLSVREAARLQSFPDNYVFSGSIGLQQQQVGNAVPPMLSQSVFEGLLSTSQGS